MRILIFLFEHYNILLFLLTCFLQNDIFTAVVWAFWGVKTVKWALGNAAERDGREGWLN